MEEEEQDSGPVVPTEVSVVEDSLCDFDSNGKLRIEQLQCYNNNNSERLEVAQAEANEYLHHLKNTQSLVDQLTKELNKSRMQVADLISQNRVMLDELKSVGGSGEPAVEEAVQQEVHLLEQELLILKICLFCGAVYLCCGGRASVFGIMSIGWLLIQFLV